MRYATLYAHPGPDGGSASETACLALHVRRSSMVMHPDQKSERGGACSSACIKVSLSLNYERCLANA